jgi:hypothetical protein|nr:MAG TPA: major capsid protein [Caudoviricetes sp.]
MTVNDLTFNQLSMVLNSIVQQATGQQAQQVTNTAEFVSVAQTALKTGYDPVLKAISQVLSRTIFSIRPYTRKFGGLMVSNQQFGNIVRKLNIADKDWEEDSRFELTDQNSVDMYKVNKPSILQTNFYGANVFEKSLTIFKDQLDCAFSNPDEFGRFVSMTMTNASDMIEQAHENLARATLANFIGGKISGDTASVIHLLTEYNTITGLETPLTAETVYQPANFKPFMQWVYSRVASLSSLMTERTQKFHINVTGKEISRHTPVNKQKVYLYAPARYQTETMVLADVYHDNFLRMADNETVNFWQSIDKPDEINVQPVYLQADGTLKSDDPPVNQKGIFGVMFDEEAAGYTVVNQWSAPTPFNSKGGYSNIFWHFTDRYWNDFTENGIVLLLD